MAGYTILAQELFINLRYISISRPFMENKKKSQVLLKRIALVISLALLVLAIANLIMSISKQVKH